MRFDFFMEQILDYFFRKSKSKICSIFIWKIIAEIKEAGNEKEN